MKNNLFSRRLRSGVAYLTGLASLLQGCSSTEKELTNKDFIYGSRIDAVSSEDNPYEVPTINHSGLILTPKVSRRQVSGEWEFTLTPYQKDGNSWVVKDRTEGEVDLETRTLFVIPVYPNERGEPAKEAIFSLEGAYASRAEVSKKRNAQGLSVETYTQEDLKSFMPTVEIDTDQDEETPPEAFYAPIVVNTDGSIKDRLLIPVKGTLDLTNTDTGQIILRPKIRGNIHFLKEMTVEDYNLRPLNAPRKSGETVMTPAVRVK